MSSEGVSSSRGSASVVGPLSDIYFLNASQTKFVCVGFAPVAPFQLQVSLAGCESSSAVSLQAEDWQKLIDAKSDIQRRTQDPEARLQECTLSDNISVLFKIVSGKLLFVFKDRQRQTISLSSEEWTVLENLQKIVSDILFHKKKEEADVQNQIMAFFKCMLHSSASNTPFESINFTLFTKYIRSANLRTFLEVQYYLKPLFQREIMQPKS